MFCEIDPGKRVIPTVVPGSTQESLYKGSILPASRSSFRILHNLHRSCYQSKSLSLSLGLERETDERCHRPIIFYSEKTYLSIAITVGARGGRGLPGSLATTHQIGLPSRVLRKLWTDPTVRTRSAAIRWHRALCHFLINAAGLQNIHDPNDGHPLFPRLIGLSSFAPRA
jgi:hypothetical protein